MSLLFSDNFDSELTLTPVWDSTGYAAIDRTSGDPYAGVGCCEITTTYGPTHNTGPCSFLHVQTYWRTTGDGSGHVMQFLQSPTSGGLEVSIVVNSDGSVKACGWLYYEATLATSAPGVVPPGVYNLFDVYVDISGTGAVVVLVNGVQVLSAVVNTVNDGTSFCGGIQLMGAGGGRYSWHDQFSLYTWDGVVGTIPSLTPICKLQPHRTMYLQGFDAYGAAAAFWGASDSGFSVSGVFRDTGDFAVLVLFDADDAFGHPLWSYLPDWNFDGLVLTFTIQCAGIQPFESKKSAYSDWPTLNCVRPDGTVVRARLDSLGTAASGRAGASATFTLHCPGTAAAFDRVTLWYQNLAFDYIAAGGETPATICGIIATQINGTDWTLNGPVALSAVASGGQVTITAAPGSDGNMVTIYELHKNANLYFTPATSAQLAGGSSDGVAWSVTVDFSVLGWTSIQKLYLTFAAALSNGLPYGSAPITDASNTMPIVIEAALPLPAGGEVSIEGATGNTAANGTWPFTVIDSSHFSLTGSIGNGAYTGGGIASVAGASAEWEVSVTDWSVTDAHGHRPLKVAGPGSVRIEETSAWVVRSGYWEAAPTDGFAYWSQGQAIRAAASGASLTIETHCGAVCDIYLGTRLDANCGIISASLDGGAPVTLDCYANPATTSQLRRRLFAGVAAGQHSVVLTLTGTKNVDSSGWYFYFDFLECAVLSDVPSAAETVTNVALATDFDTDATYQMPPQRLLWAIQKSGLVGEIDHYCGVFWWAQRVRVGAAFPSATVTFGGTWASGDGVWLTIGSVTLGKSVFPADTATTIAAHFAAFINETLVGVWASASGAVLTVTARSTGAGASWLFPLAASPAPASAAGTVAIAGSLETLVAVAWNIDPTAANVLNRAFRDWHADWFAALAAAGIGAVASFSQELVNPPDDPPGAVWVQRYPDGSVAQTATGVGSLYSSQASFSADVQAYMIAAYAAVAALMVLAGLPPRLQFGEVLWWYQGNSAGMAFYDADTAAAAWTALGHALVTFHTPNDSPAVNSYADANFLRARLAAYVAAVQAGVLALCATAVFELLWPEDVNDPVTCQLTRYINLPTAWQTRAGSGFDTFVCEGFSYAGVDQSVDKAAACAAYPFLLGWDQAHCRYLQGWYYAAWPWVREFVKVSRLRLPIVKFWAYDHLCLFGWPLPLPTGDANSFLY